MNLDWATTNNLLKNRKNNNNSGRLNWDINTRVSQTQEKNNSVRSDWDIDTSQTKPKTQRSRTLHRLQTTLGWSPRCTVVPQTTKTSRRNAIVTTRAVIADEGPHRGSPLQSRVVAASRCEPCSPPIIESACAASKDVVPRRTSHCQAGQAAVVRCKLST
jgi:hypothetical protein